MSVDIEKAEARLSANGDKSCSGFRTSGHWKGWPCGAIPKYQHNGKWYCKNHLPVMSMTENDRLIQSGRMTGEPY